MGYNDPFWCMPLLTVELSLLLRTPQQRLSMLFSFQLAGKPQICPFLWRISTTSNSPYMVHWAHASQLPQLASRLVQPFLLCSWTWSTNRQTHRPRYSVGSNGPHLAIDAMRPINNADCLEMQMCFYLKMLLNVNLHLCVLFFHVIGYSVLHKILF